MEHQMIIGPTLHIDDPERLVECKSAVAGEVIALINRIVAAGWKRGEALMCIGDLVDTETEARAEFFREMVAKRRLSELN
jgi:hypothetical protein